MMVRRLLYLNGLAILCVVIFHAGGYGFVALFDWAPKVLGVPAPYAGTPPGWNYWALRLIEQLVVFSIPAFLFVSGYFVAAMTGRGRDALPWAAVMTRVRKLLIPYLIWSAAAMLLVMIFSRRLFTLPEILVNLLTGRSNEVLYFVPLLIQYYWLSPLLTRWARSNWKLLLLVTGLIQLAVQVIPMIYLWGFDAGWIRTLNMLVPKWLFLSRIFWFTFGIIFGFQIDVFKAPIIRLRWLWLTLIAASIPLGIWEWQVYYRASGEAWLAHRETLLDTLYALAVIFGFIAIVDWRLPAQRFMENLGKDSYGIYLVHMFFILYTGRIIYNFAPQLLSYPIGLTAFWSLVSLFGTIWMMRLVAASPARRFYSILFG